MSRISLLILTAALLILAFYTSASPVENSLPEDLTRLMKREAVADPKLRNKNNKKTMRGKKNRKYFLNMRKGSRKRKNKGSKKKGGNRVSGRSINAKCIAQLTLSMRRWKDVVTNFQRQSKRITDNQKKGAGKSGKQDVFGPIASKLVTSGGGNKSSLTCGGSSTSEGARNITQLAKDLDKCEKSVNDSCNPANFPAADSSLVEECTSLTDKFAEDAQKCMVKSKDESTAAEGCTCWTDPALVQLTEDVNKCKVKEDMDAIKAQLKACTKAFGACRKLEDAAVETLSACTTDSATLTKKAASLSANKNALGNVKSKINGLTGSRNNGIQRAPATTCQGVITLVNTCRFRKYF